MPGTILEGQQSKLAPAREGWWGGGKLRLRDFFASLLIVCVP